MLQRHFKNCPIRSHWTPLAGYQQNSIKESPFDEPLPNLSSSSLIHSSLSWRHLSKISETNKIVNIGGCHTSDIRLRPGLNPKYTICASLIYTQSSYLSVKIKGKIQWHFTKCWFHWNFFCDNKSAFKTVFIKGLKFVDSAIDFLSTFSIFRSTDFSIKGRYRGLRYNVISSTDSSPYSIRIYSCCQRSEVF